MKGHVMATESLAFSRKCISDRPYSIHLWWGQTRRGPENNGHRVMPWGRPPTDADRTTVVRRSAVFSVTPDDL